MVGRQPFERNRGMAPNQEDKIKKHWGSVEKRLLRKRYVLVGSMASCTAWMQINLSFA